MEFAILITKLLAHISQPMGIDNGDGAAYQASSWVMWLKDVSL